MRNLYRSIRNVAARYVAVVALSCAVGVPLVAATSIYFSTPNTQWATVAQTARLRADSVLLVSGHLEYRSGSQPANGNSTITGTLLCSAPLDATPLNAPSSGTMTNADAITCTGTSGATGTGTVAGYVVLLKSDSSTVVATMSVGTSGANVNLPSTTITTGETVTIPAGSLTITDNASSSS